VFPQPAVVLVGQTARLQILPLPPSRCGGSTNARPTSVTAEIEGPEGLLLASQITLGLEGSSATLEFTPERPGPHHVLVAFSETGGIHQFSLHAAVNRSSEAPPQTLARRCQSLERTLKGAWVCAPEVVRGDTTLGVFSDARMAVAGDVVWVVRGSRVERYVDTGTEFRLTGATAHTLGAPEFLSASPEELVVLYGVFLSRYVFSDGVVESTGAQTWSRPPLPISSPAGGPYGVLLREGDRLALASRAGGGITPSVQLCSYELISGTFQRTQGECQTLPGEIVGFEPSVLWTKEISAPATGFLSLGILRRWEWRGGQLVEQGSLVLGSHATVIDRASVGSPTVPFIGNSLNTSSIPPLTAVVTWSPQRRALLLEYLDPAVSDVYASPTFYWTLKATGAGQNTHVRLRPPPP
jgi:hypothetical protein